MKKDVLAFPKMNLQFFAEPAEPEHDPVDPATNDPDTSNDPGEVSDPKPQLTTEEQMQQLMLENAKLKRAQEKAASEAADYKKKYNATLSDKQKADMEKAEKEVAREEQFNKLLKENSVTKLEKNFLTLGYPQDKATEAATAQYDGDTETLFKIQSEVQANLIKQKEAEWLKNRPPVNSGAGDGNVEDAFLKGFNSVSKPYSRK